MTHPSYLKKLCHMIDYQHIVGRQRRFQRWKCDIATWGSAIMMRFHYFQFRPLPVVCAIIMPGWWKTTAPPRHPLRKYGYQNKLILSPLTWWDPQFWLWRCCCSYSSSVGSSSPQFASTCPAHCETPWSGSTIRNYMKKVILSTVLGKGESTQT